MKKFLPILVLLFIPVSNVNAAEQFRLVPLDEYVKSAGSFVIDTVLRSSKESRLQHLVLEKL